MKEYIVAVVGATGAVGEEMIDVIEELELPVKRLVPLASSRSVGKKVEFRGSEVDVMELTHTVFEEEGIEIALFSAGGSISKEFAPSAARAGAVVIDNTSFFRMDEDVPLVVPEVNAEDIALWKQRGIIANPNCSTIQMVMALNPLNKEFGIKRVDVATYQAVSGAGKSAMEELMNQMRDLLNFEFDHTEVNKFTKKIAINAIPHIDKFFDNGYTKEEIKMVEETKKIMHKNIEVSATCVRVPVLKGHSEAVTIHCEDIVDANDAREILRNAPGVVVMDEPMKNIYPTPLDTVDKNESFVGRIRNDLYNKSILHFWVVADNLRVGAATNAVKIAKEWIKMQES